MTSGTGGAGMGGALPEQTIYLPFAVDDHFVPYGFMGAGTDGALKRDPNECASRPEGAQGQCHRYDYIVPEVADGWAGLYWLTTYENWGMSPGRPIETGASRVVFHAASDPPGAPVRFFAGGLDSDLAYFDAFNRWVDPALTSELSEVVIDLGGTEYSSGVLGGFGFSLASSVPVTIYIDDIRWE